MIRIADITQQMPWPAQAGLNYGAVSASIASFVGLIQGPLAVIASTLSIIWLGLQIYAWFCRRKK